jgi:hypothetical protein
MLGFQEYYLPEALPRVRRLAMPHWMWNFEWLPCSFANLKELIVIVAYTWQLQEVEERLRDRLPAYAKNCPAWRKVHEVTVYRDLAAIEKGDIFRQIYIDLTDVK